MSLTQGHFWIMGRVQGVGFRMSAQDEAIRLGLTGWVCNISDDGVEVVAEGEVAEVAKFLDWCRRGPPLARVEKVIEVYEEATGEFTDFSLRY